MKALRILSLRKFQWENSSTSNSLLNVSPMRFVRRGMSRYELNPIINKLKCERKGRIKSNRSIRIDNTWRSTSKFHDEKTIFSKISFSSSSHYFHLRVDSMHSNLHKYQKWSYLFVLRNDEKRKRQMADKKILSRIRFLTCGVLNVFQMKLDHRVKFIEKNNLCQSLISDLVIGFE